MIIIVATTWVNYTLSVVYPGGVLRVLMTNTALRFR
jgi:hypothetical protein